MIIHEPALISEDLFDKQFICDLNKCKGACCIEGEFGAPISKQEIALLEKELPAILPYLTTESKKALKKKGVYEKDSEGDLVTTCLPTGECNFAYRDERGILGCGIEKAWKEGKTAFQKPISCHLYPIRVSKIGSFEALNYHKWDICKPACKLGKAHQMPVFRFLKGALIRKFGEKWYEELEEIAEARSQS